MEISLIKVNRIVDYIQKFHKIVTKAAGKKESSCSSEFLIRTSYWDGTKEWKWKEL